MADFVRVASMAEVAVGAGMTVDLNGRQVAIFNVDGTVYAIDNLCKHKSGPLAEGEVDGTTVTCPWHGWAYDITSGECLEDSECSVDKFEVKVEADEIWLKV